MEVAAAPDPAAGRWSGRRVLVTGATGLIGSWLVRDLIAGGADVVALVLDANPQSELFRSGDIARVAVVNGMLEDYRAVERAVALHEVDTVFHLGAQTLVGVAHRSPLATFEANIRGTYNLLEACRTHRSHVERVIIASSDKAYGEGETLPYTETMPLRGTHPYEVSKSCADLLAQSYYRSYGLPVTVARCGNVYGGGDLNWSRLVPGTIRSLLRGERPVIRSDGSFRRDYIFVRDVARAYVRLAERMGCPGVDGEAFNFSDESPLSVLEMVGAIAVAVGTGVEPDIRNVAVGEIRDQYLSSSKARRVLGWKAESSLPGALRETVGWYRDALR
ncbi:MAG: NAD-dependent epimerase/dehydratase family protein [Gemmatimonadaceae bacterium]